MGSGHFGPSGRYEGIKEVAFDYAFLLSRILTNDFPRSSSTVSPDAAASSSENAPQLTPRSRKFNKPLTGGRIIKNIAHQSCLRGLIDKILHARSSRLQALQEKRIHRGVARRQLAGMQIPTLIEAVRERALHQVEMMPHGPMHNRSILRGLLFSDFSAMPRDRQNRTRPIGKIHAAAGRAHLHDVPREIARRMIQALFRRRDVATRRVIVRTEMQSSASAARCCNQLRNSDGAGRIEDRLRGFDHQLDLDCPTSLQRYPAMRIREIGNLLRRSDLRKRDREVVRQLVEFPEKQLQCSPRSCAQQFGETA